MTYLLLTDGFEEIEALAPLDFLRRCKVDVRAVSLTGNRTVVGSHGIPVTADGLAEDERMDSAEMLILPGGMPGTRNLDQFPAMTDLLRSVCSAGGYLCAICAAPSVLGKRGYLNGKRAVCYPGFEEYLTGALHSDEPVVCDGRIITAKAAGVAWQFAYECAARLVPRSVCDAVADGIFLERRRSR